MEFFFSKLKGYNITKKGECAKLRALRAIRALRTRVPTCLCFVRAFILLRALPAFTFLRALRTLSFLRALRAFSFFRALRTLIFLRALRAFIFLHAHLLFMYMLIKLTQIKELTYNCSSLLLLNSVIYQHLQVFSLLFCMIFSFFETKDVGLRYMTKKDFLSRILLMSALFSDEPISTQKSGFTLFM